MVDPLEDLLLLIKRTQSASIKDPGFVLWRQRQRNFGCAYRIGHGYSVLVLTRPVNCARLILIQPEFCHFDDRKPVLVQTLSVMNTPLEVNSAISFR